jgi:hypothetical protein
MAVHGPFNPDLSTLRGIVPEAGFDQNPAYQGTPLKRGTHLHYNTLRCDENIQAFFESSEDADFTNYAGQVFGSPRTCGAEGCLKPGEGFDRIETRAAIRQCTPSATVRQIGQIAK